LIHADHSPGARGWLRWVGLIAALVAALGLCLMPAAAAAKKAKKDRPKVMTQNLYIGSSVEPVVQQGIAGHTDGLANAAGTVINNVDANDFSVRARAIAQFIKNNKVDVIGLQEVEQLFLQIPSDGGGPSAANPNAAKAITPLIDFLDTTLNTLNKKALNKKQCKKFHEKHPKKQCYRGYSTAGVVTNADVEQPSDLDHNDGPDGHTFDITTTGESGNAAADIGKWTWGDDDVGIMFGEPPSGPNQFPTDANFDTSSTGNTPDPPSSTGAPGADCNDANLPSLMDNNPASGPSFGQSVPSGSGTWPYGGFDTDFNPAVPGVQTPLCLFHGIDADGRVVDHDALIVRKGAGVKVTNVVAKQYSPQNQLTFSLFGGAASIAIQRGYVSADVNVRGRKFHLVNTHLAAENTGSFREDQASELVAPGGPASQPNTLLIGDLNSDPDISPGSDPNTDDASNVAYNRIAAAGYRSVQPLVPTWGHSQILNNPGDNNLTKKIDWILTNNPAISAKRTLFLNRFANGLWTSDHAGVLAILK
jgi:endonuclease/exonuclease/phosphatase family metal-dependent hydrolase